MDNDDRRQLEEVAEPPELSDKEVERIAGGHAVDQDLNQPDMARKKIVALPSSSEPD